MIRELTYYTSVSFGNTLDGSFFYKLVCHDELNAAKNCTKVNQTRPGFKGFVIIKIHHGIWFPIDGHNLSLIDIDFDIADMKLLMTPSNEYINTIITPNKRKYHEETTN